MDNLCHTLVGVAIGESGLKTRTHNATVVLMVAANLPDIDVLSFVSETPAVALRRGWTHGVLAQALLPLLLTGLMIMIDRLRGRGQGALAPRRAGSLLLLSYVGVLSHVLLDWLNNYGVRLLMPFSGRWFYGDSVFIVDPWLWALLGFGVYGARRYSSRRLALTSLLAATVYIGGMVWFAFEARKYVVDNWRQQHGRAPEALMVGPVFANPMRRSVIVDAGDRYYTGSFSWNPPRLAYDDRVTASLEEHPAVIRARQAADIRAVLTWARFPYYEVRPAGESGWEVTLSDLRFGSRVGRLSMFVPAIDRRE
jgi:inner membrane protein